MALTKAQLMETPGNIIPVGAVKAGTGISITNGVMALNPDEVLAQLVAGQYATVSPASGVGEVTVGLTGEAVPDPVVQPGDRMFFLNATAPTGWTKVTTVNDATMRVVAGAGGGTGGSTNFSAAFTNFAPRGAIVGLSLTGSVGYTTIDVNSLASHSHAFESRECSPQGLVPATGALARCQSTMQGAGGNGSHTHGFSGTISNQLSGETTNQFAVQYVDCLLCSKN